MAFLGTTKRRHPVARLIAQLVVALLCFVPSLVAAAESAASLEYKVKAGYLFNFAKFIEWPASSRAATNSPFVVGVIDGGDVLPIVQSILEGKKIEGHPVQVKAVAPGQAAKGFHILFVTRAAGVSAEDVRTALGREATLVVGETERFAELGGTLGFVRDQESIRLHLNLGRANEAGLKVSSKLSSVAKIVKDKP